MIPSRRYRDRLWVRNGFRHYRPRYSLAEVRWGVVVLLGLLGIGLWIAYRGARPDPELSRAAVPLDSVGSERVDRGPLPKALATKNFREGKVSAFDAENLYVKINGRAGYFKSFGFKKLYWVALSQQGGESTVDIELYDLGSAANALGAYSGERAADIKPLASTHGLSHIDRNALLMTSGRYYLRAIGSDESGVVKAQLTHLEGVVRRALAGAPLPWAYALFVGEMRLSLGSIGYFPRNAFSFGFARHVYIARLEPTETELFVAAERNAQEAKQAAKLFREGFLSLGTAHPGGWAKDRYLGTYAGSESHQRWVIGVRGAVSPGDGAKHLARLRTALNALPPLARAQAQPTSQSTAKSPPGTSAEDEY